jgi:hypothetical protein
VTGEKESESEARKKGYKAIFSRGGRGVRKKVKKCQDGSLFSLYIAAAFCTDSRLHLIEMTSLPLPYFCESAQAQLVHFDHWEFILSAINESDVL